MCVLRQVCLITFSLAMIVINTTAQSPRVEKHLATRKIRGLGKENNALHFLVVGDWGRNGQVDQQDVADWMGVAASQLNAKFVISTGDNFYCCGVASVDDHQWISSFENVYRSHALQIPWYVSLGNHDYQGNVEAQINYSRKSQRWKLPNRYYTIVKEGVRFIFLDTSPFIKKYYATGHYPDLAQQDTTKQLQWLDSVLSVSLEKHRFIVGHHPVYSLGNHGHEQDMLLKIKPRLSKYNVPLYFAGHDHSLQSLKEEGQAIHYLISGGGAEHTKVNHDPLITRFAVESTGFMAVAVSESKIKIYFINKTGKILYEESLAIN
jgi:tartrate-resistant acid phosphatase type 5